MSNSLHKELDAGLDVLGLALSPVQIQQLLDYTSLFAKWNMAFNLSAIKDDSDILKRHILDSLSIVPYITADRILDVGTGGGLPGIPLAIVLPEKHFVLLDSNGKKTRFLFQVKTALNLRNLGIENCRAEKYHPQQKFDGITSRAFASLRDMINHCAHLLSPEGKFFAMKGSVQEEEIQQLPEHYRVEAITAINAPGNAGERHLITIRQTQ